MSARTDVVNTHQMQRAKAAYRASVAACGGQDGTAAATGKAQQRVSLYGHPNSDAFPPLDVIVAQEAVSHGTPGHPHVTRFLAREAGFELFKLPSLDGARDARRKTRWGTICAVITREHSDLMASVCAALDDGTINPREAKACLAELDEDLLACMQLRAALLAVLEDDA